ncbi:MAG TPA: zinc ribbon domain-containing protein [Verrucomicrobiae bacterium]|nr:zinc ribbon domain-containing protein [Verrucomicrobiae bacterium]
MPTYEYVCSKCGHQFEKFQSIAAKSLTICPEELCARKKWGRGKVKRLIGAGAGLLFKGSGFYITDYRSESYKQAAKKESGAPAPAKSESKSSAAETGNKTPSTKPAAKTTTSKAKSARN